MNVRLLLGPAGSGKTFRCLTEIRQALIGAPEGKPLVLVAPKQTTYQLERQLLADSRVQGYTRLHILSFDRLADFVFEQLHKTPPEMLAEQGRVMVLRALLTKRRDELKVFRASARLAGFAQELSTLLTELQRNQVSPEALRSLAEKVKEVPGLAAKLNDFAMLLQDYWDWLGKHKLQDADSLLTVAAEALKSKVQSQAEARSLESEVQSPIAGLWVDGFAELAAQELELLGGLIPYCGNATLTFCLDREPKEKVSWLSTWMVVRKSFESCKSMLERVPGVELAIECLARDPKTSRFSNAQLQYLEKAWPNPAARLERAAESPAPVVKTTEPPSHKPSGVRSPNSGVQLEWLWPGQNQGGANVPLRISRKVSARKWKAVECVPVGKQTNPATSRRSELATSLVEIEPRVLPPANESKALLEAAESAPSALAICSGHNLSVRDAVRVAMCADPEGEAIFAAREVLRHVRAGGRYREVTILVRKLELYHEQLQRVFSRYQIPFFMDRRESVSHHPLAELTRSALRVVATQWRHDEWFAALKTGLVDAADEEIDRLENEALARGWKGAAWHQPIHLGEEPKSETAQQELQKFEQWLENLRQKLVAPFERLELALGVHQNKPTGPQLGGALRQLWTDLGVEQRLQQWAEAEAAATEFAMPTSVHATVWDQMNDFLKNMELAFANEALPLREWISILDAGLAGFTVGVIPPALDQVLVGSIDRSRNPDVKLALVLGMNETLFPAPPERSALLTETDEAVLEERDLVIGPTMKKHLGRERYLAYLALTRAREKVVLTSAMHDADGVPLNPSPFLSQLKELLPDLKFETVPRMIAWQDAEHPYELIAPLLSVQGLKSTVSPKSKVQSPKSKVLGPEPSPAAERVWEQLMELPAVAKIVDGLAPFRHERANEGLSPEMASRLYGSVLKTSVSRIEQYAACAFRFFVHSGLKAEERKRFELDVREQGSFQHDVLAEFHRRLKQANQRWRDLTPQEARAQIGSIASSLMATYRDGLLQANHQSEFKARMLSAALQDFIETLVGWMREQYQFDPVEVELPFGEDERSPAWQIQLANGQRLALYGRIDRIDLCKSPAGRDANSTTGADVSHASEALCAVVDYKSSPRKLDPVLMEHGLQLQLLAYLSVLRHWPDPEKTFGVERLIPAGVFYVNLRGIYLRAANRDEALADSGNARKQAYRHFGRFDLQALRQFDARIAAKDGDQFNYKLNYDGQIHKRCLDLMMPSRFSALLDSVERNLKKMGEEIFAGNINVFPFRKGLRTACETCSYQAICRFDPWSHPYRSLTPVPKTSQTR